MKMGNESQTKLCKHCQTEISKKAKVCPNCGKKQGGILKWIIIVILVLAAISAMAGGDDESASDSNPKKVDNVTQDDGNEDNADTQEEVDNTFSVGEVLETSNLKISYLSAEQYSFDNEYIQPQSGNVFYRMEFEFENTGDSDQLVSSLDFECYADGYSMEECYYGDDTLQATLSAGKKAKGAVYFEVPADATEITLEYELNYWTEDKVIFVVK